MQIVINKVENGYICTLDGKIYIMYDLAAVTHFLARQFNDYSVTDFRIVVDKKEYESLTSDSD